MTTAKAAERPEGAGRNRRLARLAAVQALYQVALTGGDPAEVLAEFLQHRLEEELEGVRLGEIDRELFADLVRQGAAQAEPLDDMIAAVLAEDWTVERLETLLRIILRLGAYELAERQDIPSRVVINEYVDLAHAFFEGKEPAMANAMLDRLAHTLRREEFEGEPGPGQA